MSYLRVSTAGADVPLEDLGYTVVDPTTNFVISNQFSVEDLQNSVSLRDAINNGDLTAEVNLDGSWTAVVAGEFDPRDPATAMENLYEIANTVDNQRLVDNSDASSGTQLHHHDARYFTETEVSGTGGAALVGVDASGFVTLSPASTTVQQVLEDIDDKLTSAVTLDAVYDNDSDGILNVDNSGKALDFRSDNVNDIVISRTNGSDIQDLLRADVSADELVLGSAAVGALAAAMVRIKTNLIVEGNIQWTGTLTDTTVDELNVTNANIRLRDNATVGGDANLFVERGTTGADASVKWDETADRWKAGLDGSEQTIALLEANETVTGEWLFTGPGTTSPNFLLTEKSAAPSTNLGSAGQIPVTIIGGILAVYDKSNSRNKFLSVSREYMTFSGRDSTANTNEYARLGTFTSNQGGSRLMRNATLVGISAQTNGSETWSVRVRKNGSVTNLASLGITAAAGGQDVTFNIDFNAGDDVEVFIDGTNINRPTVVLEFAYRF